MNQIQHYKKFATIPSYNSKNFEDAIYKTLLKGGDTNANSAIAGSMAESLHGIDNELIEKAFERIQKIVKLLNKVRK